MESQSADRPDIWTPKNLQIASLPLLLDQLVVPEPVSNDIQISVTQWSNSIANFKFVYMLQHAH